MKHGDLIAAMATVLKRNPTDEEFDKVLRIEEELEITNKRLLKELHEKEFIGEVVAGDIKAFMDYKYNLKKIEITEMGYELGKETLGTCICAAIYKAAELVGIGATDCQNRMASERIKTILREYNVLGVEIVPPLGETIFEEENRETEPNKNLN